MKKVNNIIVVIIILIVSLFNGYTFARYAKESKKDFSYIAKEFYFESDMLVHEDEEIPIYKLMDGSDTISFNIFAHPIHDTLNITETDINYDVIVKDKDGNIVKELLDNELTIVDNEALINIHSLDSGIYEIEAKSIYPYSKVLKGKFILTGVLDDIDWYVIDESESPLLTLYVSTQSYEGNVTISWLDGLIPNTSIEQMEDAIRESKQHTIYLNSYSEYKIEFFKEGSILDNNYTQKKDDNTGDFIISKI